MLLDGKATSPKTKVWGGEQLTITPMSSHEEVAFQPEVIDIPIIFEDDQILVINKPAGRVVHPASGNWSGTLLNGLLHHYPELTQIPRAGIVHRLDKDTSGLMVVAKTLVAQTELIRQLQTRTMQRVYRAIVDGHAPSSYTIETLIGRDPHNRLKMAVLKFGGKQAITHVRVLERFSTHSFIECRLETGRTHQIRVHMRETKHPLTGDQTYGNPRHKSSQAILNAVKSLQRQALHAYSLTLAHPTSGAEHTWQAPLPDDVRLVLELLREEHNLIPLTQRAGDIEEKGERARNNSTPEVIYAH